MPYNQNNSIYPTSLYFYKTIVKEWLLHETLNIISFNSSTYM